ncbi:MAG: methyl-accepting chemotaxis protein [Planctomycetota bacterium]|nr:methyl-accepting chemotaxis protein [Planctomycetota bacterium]
MKTASKLALGFGSVIALFSVAAVLSLSSVRSVAHDLVGLNQKHAQFSRVTSLVSAVMEARLAVSEFSNHPSEANVREANRRRDNLAALVGDMGKDPTLRDNLSGLDRSLAGFSGAMNDIFKAEAEVRKLTDELTKSASTLTSLLASELTSHENDPAFAKALSHVSESVSHAEEALLKYEISGETADDRAAAELVTALGKSFDELGETAREVREGVDAFTTAATRLRAAVAREHQLSMQIVEHGDAMDEIADATIEQIDKEQEELKKMAKSDADTAQTLALGALIVVPVVGAAFGIVISRGISSRLNALRTRIDSIHQSRDFTQRVQIVGSDEVAELGQEFNKFLDGTAGIIRDVSASANQVAAAATQIAATAEELSAGMQKQEEQASLVASAVREMSSSAADVAQKGSEAARAATTSGEQASKGGTIVQETVGQMEGIAEQVKQSAAAVSELGKKGEQIGRIIGVINDIADQTNLLALNAAIEAARAGEHGRGFAVVADEVRKLAERTTKATEEVAGSIREIQTETENAVGRMQEGTASVTKGVDLAGKAGTSLSEIVDSSKSLQGLVASIAAAAEEQSAASEQMSRSVQEITNVIRESTQGAGQAAQAASDLSRNAEGLREIVGRFKV